MTTNELWGECLDYIKSKIPEQAFQTWFDGITASQTKDSEIMLQVPNQFHYEWLDSKYHNLINSAIQKNIGKELKINYSVIVSDQEENIIPDLILEKKRSIEQPIRNGLHKASQLNNRYIFDNYIEGKSNQLAKAASLSVAESPGQTPFNPLLIYSETGLGKTHLLQAIGNSLLEISPNSKIVYLTSEKFMLDFITAIQNNKSAEFSKQYRNVDMLLIDDVQFFQNKEQTQEQFFHLFNDLHHRGKQIVMTTDRHPNELRGLKNRLISRFQSGLIVDIQPPDLETRIAILMKKADSEGLEISFEIIEFIASSITENVRDLEGALIRLLAFASLKRQDINMILAKQVILDIMGTTAFQKITIEHVLKIVSKEMRVTERQLIGKTRTMEIAIARQTAMYLSRELTSSSLVNIGLYFGGRDHSTVIHACKTIEKKINTNPELKRTITKLKKELGGPTSE
ncbi:MAG: chromosomal replication initiator protein DnaA [Candidatus Neomarinimicrobiota bacterium]|nr:chromosomal replication initiator protein DnaA [Candidatus Neomarinimicrobiota bacterium]